MAIFHKAKFVPDWEPVVGGFGLPQDILHRYVFSDVAKSNIHPDLVKAAAQPHTTASEIAARASDLVGGDRDRQHGQKSDNFERIATMWNAYLAIRRHPDAQLTAVDVGHMMAAMKLARTQSGALNVDDYIDGAGYLACAGEIAQRGG